MNATWQIVPIKPRHRRGGKAASRDGGGILPGKGTGFRAHPPTQRENAFFEYEGCGGLTGAYRRGDRSGELMTEGTVLRAHPPTQRERGGRERAQTHKKLRWPEPKQRIVLVYSAQGHESHRVGPLPHFGQKGPQSNFARRSRI